MQTIYNTIGRYEVKPAIVEEHVAHPLVVGMSMGSDGGALPHHALLRFSYKGRAIKELVVRWTFERLVIHILSNV